MWGHSYRKERLRKIDALIEAGKVAPIVTIPLNRGDQDKSIPDPSLLLQTDRDTSVKLSLIAEYETLYRHYDVRANNTITVLVAIAPVLLNAPLFLAFASSTKGLIVTLGGICIALLSLFSFLTLRMLRLRMKTMSVRSRLIQDELYSDEQIDLPAIRKAATEQAKQDIREFRGFFNPHSNRSAIWAWIAAILFAYSTLYIFGGILIINNPSFLEKNQINVVIDSLPNGTEQPASENYGQQQ
ncbi:hypothetical protein [Hyphococcus luteus]|uniref:Uncharacterized protein n=1 Tax=Hyphococcus luteus TaxID=2058213 RepID=A0A2S7K7A0_9PROT|nr:hypothetical protein [Marinicaulis flavus]PQA88395.1 hypothetical protein CW354_08855 [Marinicaulis flavus]